MLTAQYITTANGRTTNLLTNPFSVYYVIKYLVNTTQITPRASWQVSEAKQAAAHVYVTLYLYHRC